MRLKRKKLSFENDLLRQPGQSLVDQLDELFDEKIDSHLFSIFFAILLVAFVWLNYFLKSILNPFLITPACCIIVGYFIIKIQRLKKDVEDLKQGIRGERYVGQVLEELREDGYKIFHDIVGNGFNIDHALVGPKGIFVIETKTWSNNHTINTADYDGEILRLNNHAVPRNPIKQAQSCARYISDLVSKSIGEKTNLFVQPIIALPSKYIKPEVNKVLEKEGIFIINPKNIRSFINSRNDVHNLSPEKISQIALHLSRLIASSPK